MYVHICQPISFNIPCCFYCPALVWLALFDFDFGLDFGISFVFLATSSGWFASNEPQTRRLSGLNLR